jgi:hypothetical protein
MIETVKIAAVELHAMAARHEREMIIERKRIRARGPALSREKITEKRPCCAPDEIRVPAPICRLGPIGSRLPSSGTGSGHAAHRFGAGVFHTILMTLGKPWEEVNKAICCDVSPWA